MHEYKGMCDQRWLTGEVKGNSQVAGSLKLAITEVSCDAVSGAKRVQWNSPRAARG